MNLIQRGGLTGSISANDGDDGATGCQSLRGAPPSLLRTVTATLRQTRKPTSTAGAYRPWALKLCLEPMHRQQPATDRSLRLQDVDAILEERGLDVRQMLSKQLETLPRRCALETSGTRAARRVWASTTAPVGRSTRSRPRSSTSRSFESRTPRIRSSDRADATSLLPGGIEVGLLDRKVVILRAVVAQDHLVMSMNMNEGVGIWVVSVKVLGSREPRPALWHRPG